MHRLCESHKDYFSLSSLSFALRSLMTKFSLLFQKEMCRSLKGETEMALESKRINHFQNQTHRFDIIMDCAVDFDVEPISKIVCRGDTIRHNTEKYHTVVLIPRIKSLHHSVS